MAFGELLKGWAFITLLRMGFGFIIGGMIFLVLAIYEAEVLAIFCSVPLFLLGTGLTYWGYRIWRKEKEKEAVRSSEDRATIGYSKKLRLKKCPECGEKEMSVAFDNSGVCNNCGHSTQQYSDEIEPQN